MVKKRIIKLENVVTRVLKAQKVLIMVGLQMLSFLNLLSLLFVMNSECLYLGFKKLDWFGLPVYSSSLIFLLVFYGFLIFVFGILQVEWLKLTLCSWRKLFLFAPFVFVLCPVTFALYDLFSSGLEKVFFFGDLFSLEVYYPKDVLINIGKEMCRTNHVSIPFVDLELFAELANGSPNKMVAYMEKAIEAKRIQMAQESDFISCFVHVIIEQVCRFFLG